MKTLAQLLIDNPGLAHTSNGPYFVILPGYSAEQARDIFALSDFKVESCEGGCYWLRPCRLGKSEFQQ